MVMNLQTNGIKERMHLLVADMMGTMTFKVDIPKEGIWHIEVDILLQAVAWAIRSTVNAGMKYAPTNLLFNKDRNLNKEIQVNWTAIKNY